MVTMKGQYNTSIRFPWHYANKMMSTNPHPNSDAA